MPEASDMDLVRRYARRNSEPAFTELVHRHVNLVHSVALRYVGNAEDAQDVAQAVFIILAQKAAGLREKTVLTGWLYETTRFTAAGLLRTRARRQAREQEAYMQSTLNAAETDNAWRQLEPLLEDAMTRLTEKERTLLALRFYENKTGPEAAAAMGIRESATHKRAARAVEKLRAFFARHGIGISAGVLIAAVSANSVQAAPVTLTKTISAVAVTKGAAASGSTLTLIKGALKIMAWTKAKTAVVAVVAVILATCTTTVIVNRPPAVDESLWSVNSDNLAKAPSVLIIRPARDPNRSGSVDEGNKIIGLNLPISSLFTRAYGPGFGAARMIFPTGVARQHYDLMLTLPNHESESLRDKLDRQLGLVARREIVETNVLWLKVKDAATLESRISKGGSPVGYMTSDVSSAKIVITNQPLSALADQLESLLKIPTVDQTGLKENFDINLKWNRIDPRHDSLKNALLDQLGLELVPTNAPIEMLVVETTK